ncbi:hypothetical protein EVAR_51468_1 [Eumeta japonica]|uniref:Uncharacterized protein n=1 Tax=Eumeta variegata TaxID=151549 RepID=A0A4C1Z1F7_EUMVA|nr:hypothetical protein EVAR_51468_1 [Eumeta japonica]
MGANELAPIGRTGYEKSLTAIEGGRARRKRNILGGIKALLAPGRQIPLPRNTELNSSRRCVASGQARD